MNHEDKGLAHDLRMMSKMAHRREVLRWLATAACIPLVGCSSAKESGADTSDTSAARDTSGDTSSDTSTSFTDDGSCATIPEETAGPYPGDGSNGQNALSLSGIVRSDIRSSIGSGSGTAKGVLLRVRMKVVDTKNGCGPMSGLAVYIWHCDQDGNYSMYALPNENYLRGVQITDADGVVSFTTIFPGCYSGRWPHIHFEVYPDEASISNARNAVATSQIAVPEDSCNEAYATSGYSDSVRNLADANLSTDNVFSDGVELQTPTVTGNATDGFVISLEVGI